MRSLADWLKRFRCSDSAHSLADQVIVSGVSFLVTVLLGRCCGARELGTYSLGFTVIAFALCAQWALVAVPYTNTWRRLPAGQRREFAGCSLIQQLLLAGIISAVLLGAALTLSLTHSGGGAIPVVLILAAALPFYLLREFARRHAFAHLRMRTALILDAGVAAVQAGGLLFLYSAGRLSGLTAFGVMGAGAALGTCGWYLCNRRLFPFRGAMLRQAMGIHWRFGRWVLASAIVGTVQGYLIHWLLAFTSDVAATGVFAACMTVNLSLNLLIQGIGNVLEPKAARCFVQGGRAALKQLVWRLTFAAGAAMLVYCAAVLLWGGWLVGLLYQGAEYARQDHLVFVLALCSALGALELAACQALRTLDRPDLNFHAACWSLLVTMLAGLSLVKPYGPVGGAYALLAGGLCTLLIRVTFFVHLSAEPKPDVSLMETAA